MILSQNHFFSWRPVHQPILQPVGHILFGWNLLRLFSSNLIRWNRIWLFQCMAKKSWNWSFLFEHQFNFLMDHLWLATIRAGAGCGQAEMEVMLTLPCFGRVWFMLRPGQAKTMTQDQDQENAQDMKCPWQGTRLKCSLWCKQFSPAVAARSPPSTYRPQDGATFFPCCCISKMK